MLTYFSAQLLDLFEVGNVTWKRKGISSFIGYFFDRIFGFTTSASMWLFAIIGILLGVGEYLLGTLVYSMVWGVIYTDAYLERHSIGSYHRKLIITASMKAAQKDIESLLVLFTQKHKLISTEVDKKNNRLSLTYLIEGRREAINAGLKKFYDKEWFEGLKVE